MQVLGFDPSLTQFGWAIHDTDGTGLSRCVDRGRFKTTSKNLFVARYVEMRENVQALLDKTGIQRIGCEFPVFHDLYSEGMYALFIQVCEALWREKRDVVFFSPGQAKAQARIVLGRPTKPAWVMRKPDMVEAAKADTGGVGNWNHNEADAYWIARTAARFWMFFDGVVKLGDLNELERKQFADIHTFTRGKHAGETVEKGLMYREDERFFLWSSPNE
jgi:Holliday junction resolvasome RuvABC endonuclease subunit